jgi:hypothetical protein
MNSPHPRVNSWMAPTLFILAGIAALIVVAQWIAGHL